MTGIARIGCVIVLGIATLTGCNQGATPDASASRTSANATVTKTQADTSTKAIASATADWLDAVLKGDTQRASSRLTPQAMQRIIASGKQFSPPGLESASFRIGEVRAPSQDQAIVQCVLTDTSEGAPHSEEMCCLLRWVDNDWRVSGIAYGTAPDQPWMLTDFETGQNTQIPRQTASDSNGAAPSPNGTAGQPTPPRTAQEAPPAERR